MSHREFRTRIAELDEKEYEPTTSDYYLMQVAGHTHHAMSDGKHQWKISDYEIKFKSTTPLTEAQKVARSKARWGARLKQGEED